ncbi:MAG: LysM peptidoglycan-binding domain-containing protein [Lachnospiraceae bacterium]|nr:LysM peptidoglycan-binding domain-containing protein [Lachnospiraceae bacterium]
MNIRLIPVGSGSKFTFPALPEKLKGSYAAKYQSFDIISKGTVKVPKGVNVTTFSWEGEFFGVSKRNEPIVKKNAWQEPTECVKILTDFMEKETVLNLIVTETWINADVTISSFQAFPYGAYGNIKYSIEFTIKRDLKIYTTNEIKISSFVKKTKPRNDSASAPANSGKGSYTVVSGDTLWAIAAKHCGGGSNWTKLYDANASTIEAAAKAHGKSSSDHGHWIWPGEVFTLV